MSATVRHRRPYSYDPQRLADDAQSKLDRHPVDASTGRCRGCALFDCADRELALRVLARLGLLPKRRPGLSAPALIGARRVVR